MKCNFNIVLCLELVLVAIEIIPSKGERSTFNKVIQDCKRNQCDENSWCKTLSDEISQCACNPGYYLSFSLPDSSGLREAFTCEPGLLFAGILFFSNENMNEIGQEEVQSFLNDAYRTMEGFEEVMADDYETANNAWTYELAFKRGEGINQDLISSAFECYLTNKCGTTSNECEVSNEVRGVSYTFTIQFQESVANAGIASSSVCSSIQGYCDIESTKCLNENGMAICQCLDGYVNPNKEERFCTENVECEIDTCKDPASWCKEGTDFDKCICKPGYYATQLSTCEPGVLFGGKLVLVTENGYNPLDSEVQLFLYDAYKNSDGFLDVAVVDETLRSANERYYDLTYVNGTGASLIEETLRKYLVDVCPDNDPYKECEVSASGDYLFKIDGAASIENAGIPNDKVCPSIEGYCYAESTECVNENGMAICRCLEGYVSSGTDERFCRETVDCETSACSDPRSWCKDEIDFDECVCKPGFYSPIPSTCEPGVLFGGKLFITDTGSDSPTNMEVQRFLYDVFKSSTGFLNVVVVEESLTSTDEWFYDLTYVSSTFFSSVKDTFRKYLIENADCTGDDPFEDCRVEGALEGSYDFEIDGGSSIRNAGFDSPTVCSSLKGYCDATSTKCKNVNGYATCECLPGYNRTKEMERICSKVICSEAKHCNSPFGSCKSNAKNPIGECQCMFGFEGTKCNSPWLFVFIIAGGALFLSTLALITVLAIRSRSKAEGIASPESTHGKEESFDEETSEESRWSSQEGGLRARLPENFMRNPAFEYDKRGGQVNSRKTQRQSTKLQTPNYILKTHKNWNSRPAHYDPQDHRNY